MFISIDDRISFYSMCMDFVSIGMDFLPGGNMKELIKKLGYLPEVSIYDI